MIGSGSLKLFELLCLVSAAGWEQGTPPKDPHEAFLRDVVIQSLQDTREDTSLKQKLKAAVDRYDEQFSPSQRILRTLTDPWVLFGLLAQMLFMMRFIIQWLASEKRQRSYVPVAFWYFSLAGGVMLLMYALKKQDLVFTLGQGLGCLIYIRNLILIHRRKMIAFASTDRQNAATLTDISQRT